MKTPVFCLGILQAPSHKRVQNMANTPVLSINHLVLTIEVDPDRQAQVKKRMDDALIKFKDSVEAHKPSGRYKVGYSLTAPNGEAINIEANPAREDYRYLRVSYSPAKLGPDGTEQFVEYLRYVLGENYPEEFYSGFVQEMVVGFELRGMFLNDSKSWLCIPKKSGEA